MSTDDTPASPKPKAKRPLTPEQKAQIAAAPYDQGFGKPPKATQFRKGVSGNPSGRPKEARSMRTDMHAVLDLEVDMHLPGGPQRMSMQRSMVFAVGAKAAKGDVRAIMAMIRLMELTTPERLKEAADDVKLDPAEQARLEQLLTTFGFTGTAPIEASAVEDTSSQPMPGEPEDDDDIGFAI